MTQPQRPRPPRNERSLRIRQLATPPAYPEDDEPTKPGIVPLSPTRPGIPDTAATLLERTLPLFPPAARLPALALLLAAALLAAYLWMHR